MVGQVRFVQVVYYKQIFFLFKAQLKPLNAAVFLTLYCYRSKCVN